jgi:hypothetical protein
MDALPQFRSSVDTFCKTPGISRWFWGSRRASDFINRSTSAAVACRAVLMGLIVVAVTFSAEEMRHARLPEQRIVQCQQFLATVYHASIILGRDASSASKSIS